MDSISDAIATAEEIREAISTAVPSANGIDDAELEAELNSILAEKKTEEKEQPLVGLPEVPVEEPHVEATLSEESLAQRLKRLRESAS